MHAGLLVQHSRSLLSRQGTPAHLHNSSSNSRSQLMTVQDICHKYLHGFCSHYVPLAAASAFRSSLSFTHCIVLHCPAWCCCSLADLHTACFHTPASDHDRLWKVFDRIWGLQINASLARRGAGRCALCLGARAGGQGGGGHRTGSMLTGTRYQCVLGEWQEKFKRHEGCWYRKGDVCPYMGPRATAGGACWGSCLHALYKPSTILGPTSSPPPASHFPSNHRYCHWMDAQKGSKGWALVPQLIA